MHTQSEFQYEQSEFDHVQEQNTNTHFYRLNALFVSACRVDECHLVLPAR